MSEFQKMNQYIQHLPNNDTVILNANNEFLTIKENICKSILLNELRPGLVHWTSRLLSYLNEYGFYFNKSDHLNLIQIYTNLITTPKIDLLIVEQCLKMLTQLLKKPETLTHRDLVIEWRPLYELYLRIHRINDMSTELAPDNIEKSTFLNFIHYARIYFDKNATKEMLNEWRPLICPFDMSMNDAFERFNLFLPTVMENDDHSNGVL
jgi:proteasome activator subunit 4